MPNIKTRFSNFPKGFANGVNVRGIPVLNSYPGNVFWVDSVHGSDANHGTFDRPFASVPKALLQVKADLGDIIAMKSGHAETITAAAGWAVNISGVAILGFGQGADRPTLTFSTATTASVLITANNVTIQNLVGVTAINALTQPFDVRATDCYLDIEWQDPTTILEAATCILTTAATKRLQVLLKYKGQTGGSACVAPIKLVGVASSRIDIDFVGKASTSVVNFATTASTDVFVNGYMYNASVTDGSKDIVDTITGSTWFGRVEDGSAGEQFSGGSGKTWAKSDTIEVDTVIADLAVPAADATTNVNERDVIGNKTDAAVTAVAATKSILAYAKGIITQLTVAAANATNNAFEGDVIGNKTDTAVYTPGTTKSIIAHTKGTVDMVEKGVVSSQVGTVPTGTTIFTVAGGPIEITGLVSIALTANGAGTANTFQYATTSTLGGLAGTISGASATLASAVQGTVVTLIGTALSTAPVISATGVGLMTLTPIIVQAGTISITVGVGTNTGTWAHYLRYKPLAPGVTVV